MASISYNKKTGRRTLQFVGPDEKRKSIRLGKMNKRAAEAIKAKVEHLISYKLSGCSWDNETAHWVANLSSDLARRLVEEGLIPPRGHPGSVERLGAFLDSYIESRAKLAQNTRRNYEVTKKHLLDYFGQDRRLRDITPGDADDWNEQLRQKLADATVSREVKRARQFFRAAVRRRLLDENPFADIKTPAQVNNSREFFVDRETITKVIDACPDNQWKLIVALSRYGGLRCPSEHLGMMWDDVDWRSGKITVRSPKTKHHNGGESRLMPLFPELRPHLEAVLAEAPTGAQHVISRYRSSNANLRTQLLRIIDRAGVEPWPKLFHNMRASRQTELATTFELHAVCEWLGNSVAIADKHYLQVTDDHYQRAIGGAAKSGAQEGEGAARALQNPVQHIAASDGTDVQETQKARETRALLLLDASAVNSMPDAQAPPRGVEPLSSD